jgi:hypothetical protein
MNYGSMVKQAQGIVATVGGTIADLSAARPDIRLARRQIRATQEKLAQLDAELAQVESTDLDASALVERVATTHRTLRGLGDSHTRAAAYLARLLDACAHLATGYSPAQPALDVEDIESIRLAVHVRGIADTVLTWFAIAYPAYAVKIDRASLDRLITAWTAPFEGAAVEGSKWPVIVDVWRTRIGYKLEPQSVKKEMAKLPK